MSENEFSSIQFLHILKFQLHWNFISYENIKSTIHNNFSSYQTCLKSKNGKDHPKLCGHSEQDGVEEILNHG